MLGKLTESLSTLSSLTSAMPKSGTSTLVTANVLLETRVAEGLENAAEWKAVECDQSALRRVCPDWGKTCESLPVPDVADMRRCSSGGPIAVVRRYWN